ncbi:tyrosine-protein phosphatase [Yinghuangia seranimata]|uniref:tyrosine-protein phosphatase n=1 Tax=Yinghuangia seranimata TaxID=408067 RepID=UPI00248C8AD9|nr:tyrosine-protein phosphatase [Yinghuangia seranimata]MDI2128266.1 tyrosine-protein phosphatase [Yinghuangia seranimata]
MTTPTPILTTAPNFRDAGGHATADGRKVRTGLVFRSDGLAELDAADTDTLVRLGIGLVCDLRSEHERENEPDRLPDGVELLVADVMGHGNNELFGDVFADPKRAGEILGGQAGIDLMSEVYRRFVATELAREAYRAVFTRMAEAERGVVFHCSQGKDRTGWTSAVLLTLLGVPRAAILEDYLDSAKHLHGKNSRILEVIAERGFDPEHLRPMFSVRQEYLDTAFRTVDEMYGSVERYVLDGMGVPQSAIDALRARLLEG